MILDEYTVIMEPPHPPGWRMQPHAHTQSEFTFVRRGSCYVRLGSDLYLLHAGDAIYLPGGVSHGHEPHLHQEVEFIVVQFPGLPDKLHRELLNTGAIGIYRLSDLERSRFIDYCYQLQREIARGLPHTDIQCRALVDQLAVILLRCGLRQGKPDLTAEQQLAIDQALRWIHQHFNEPFLISDVATLVGFSPAHFRLLFRRAMGISPKQYVLALRLQSSKCMLMQPDRTIGEIAQKTGFDSPQAFSKAFRQFTGVTPTQWKSTHIK